VSSPTSSLASYRSTATGLGRRLKEHDTRIRLVCVFPETFPGIEGLKAARESWGHCPLDPGRERHRTSVSMGTSEDAYKHGNQAGTRRLLRRQSSGAYIGGSRKRVARRERAGRFVTLFNDLGERYFSPVSGRGEGTETRSRMSAFVTM